MTAREGPAAALAFVVVAGFGCGEEPVAETRRIVPHGLAGCALAAQSSLVFNALGDFGAAYAAGVADPKGSRDLALPIDLLGAEAASVPPGFRGVGYAARPADVHLTIWSATEACDALPDDGARVPESLGGGAMATFAEGRAVIVAGLEPPFDKPAGDSAFALTWDARTGEKLAPVGMLTYRRAWATATSFGDGALVAGGVDTAFLPREVIASALVFRDGSFRETLISIGDPRARHGAVVLASGATLLVGGEGTSGRALSSLVAIAPSSGPELGRASIFGLGELAAARKLPAVLRLADDRVLVAGGIDDQGRPVATLEWFNSDASACATALCTLDPGWPPRRDRAFLALAGGGVLAVGGVDPATDQPATDAWMILPEAPTGDVVRLPDLSPSQRGRAKVVRLVGAADGSPWLWNGERWFQFDPWTMSFTVPDAAPDDGPADDTPAPVEVDPGLFMWLGAAPGGASSTTRLRGFRHAVRGPFARDPAPLLFADTEHVAPDRPTGPTTLDFDGTWLKLARAAPTASRALVTDTAYADFDLSADVAGEALPEIDVGAFRAGSKEGAEECRWPQKGATLALRRRGAALQLEVDGRSGPRPCQGPSGRVAIALRASSEGEALVRKLIIARR